jgi:hypothetical protein
LSGEEKFEYQAIERKQEEAFLNALEQIWMP